MKQKLIITLNEQTTARYLQIASRRTAAEVEADCEPSGIHLTIEISPLFESAVYVNREEIGEADVELKDG
jgi:hypothetical protein